MGFVRVVGLAALVVASATAIHAEGERRSSAFVGDLTLDELEPKNEARLGPPRFERAGYVWPYTTGPHYGRVAPGASREAGVIHTAVGSFRLGRESLPLPRELTVSREAGAATGYYVVQFRSSGLTGERLDELHALIRNTGGEVLRFMPVAARIARLTPASRAALVDQPEVLAIEPYHPAFKLDPSIGRTPLYDPHKALSDRYSLDVQLHRGEDVDEFAGIVRELGGTVTRAWNSRLLIELPALRLGDLARIDAVSMVHERLPYLPADQKITNAIQVGGIRGNANPFHDAGIRGEGQVLMVLDDGIQLDAGDLSDTSTSPGTPGSAHRKVAFYGPTDAFGGRGDDHGCDDPVQGGFTHGHLVSAVALGNPEHADLTFRAADGNGTPWELTGVAPDARLAAYDAHITPLVGTCLTLFEGARFRPARIDHSQPGLDVGQLYDPAPGIQGSLEDAYDNHAARTFNLSWGADNSNYTNISAELDAFLHDRPEAMVFASSGNLGADADNDGRPDPGNLTEPGTAKNAVTVGSHGGPDDFAIPENIDERSFFSGTGPAGQTGRIAPLLMAPGEERGTTGKPIAFACRTPDNGGQGAVTCDPASSKRGTSYASAAAAGSALLVRDYFARGFYPDGTSSNPGNAADLVPDVSGALVKAALIASAEFLGRDYRGTNVAPIDNLTVRSRFNNEQGYGRIQLDNVLPLANWSAGPAGLIVVDGGIDGGVQGFAGSAVTGTIETVSGETQSAAFEICDDSQELRIALAWVEAPSDGLLNDLDLEIVTPSGNQYFGNYFTDDDNGNGWVDPSLEDCPSRFDDGTPKDQGVDRSEWSLATCTRPGNGTIGPSLPPRDTVNPTEAIFLSPNPEGRVDEAGEPILRTGFCADASRSPCGYEAQCDGVPCIGGTSQVEAGTYTLTIRAPAGATAASQRYALVIAGGVCAGSSVAFDEPAYVCDDVATIRINERDEPTDPGAGLSAAVVASRMTVEVVDAAGTVVDTEPGTALDIVRRDSGSLQFVASGVPITDGTSYDPGNGALDVRSGDTLRVVYRDADGGAPDPDRVRTSEATVDCGLRILAHASRFAQFGVNTDYLVAGGCERNARGLFEFGYPDRYMDAGESIAYRVAWTSIEDEPLRDVTTELSCVMADTDSPADCEPGGTACADPDRVNNPPCTDLRIVDPFQVVGLVDPRAALSSNHQIAMNSVIHGSPVVEFLLRISGGGPGKRGQTLIVNRHRLNVDEATVRYSTDFPHGGTLAQDRNNDGLISNPVTTGVTGFPTTLNTDYVFETIVYSDLTQGRDAADNPVVVNDGIQAPWNFDTSDGGFTTGIAAGTDDGLISEALAQWGEDKNFNNTIDGHCRSNPGVRCGRFSTDPLSCGFCDAASTEPGIPCTTAEPCGGGTCDFTCENLEDRDPDNFPVPLLDQNWSTRGGCGWQTRAPQTCAGDGSMGCYNDGDCGASGPCTGPAPATGGIWHTGRIGGTIETDCGVVGNGPGQCQLYETIGGLTGALSWFELLVTPELTKVDQALDETGGPRSTAEITDFRFNWAIDLPDNNASVTVEFDNDTERLEPVDLYSDATVLLTVTGDYGAISRGGNPFLSRGWGLFAPLDAGTGMTRNGTVGNNRVGKNSCWFEGNAVLSTSLEFVFDGLPPDDDANEGYCPSGGGIGGTDPHLDYCTTVCSDNAVITCSSDAACVGTCIGASFCGHAPTVACSADADCNLGTCVDIACNGSCIESACSNGKPGACTSDADCAEACVFTSAAIDEYVTPNGPVRGFELNDFNGPDMRFATLLDIFGRSAAGAPAAPSVSPVIRWRISR